MIRGVMSGGIWKGEPKEVKEDGCLFSCGEGAYCIVLITNEVVDEVRRKKRKCLIFKVDYEKAYNSMCWKFLL